MGSMRENVTIPQQASTIYDWSGICRSSSGTTGCYTGHIQAHSNHQLADTKDASHLEGFLGLTSYFRDLIKGYAWLEAPLRNILCQVNIPAGTKKQAYQRIMKAHKLQRDIDPWTHKDIHSSEGPTSIQASALSPPIRQNTLHINHRWLHGCICGSPITKNHDQPPGR